MNSIIFAYKNKKINTIKFDKNDDYLNLLEKSKKQIDSVDILFCFSIGTLIALYLYKRANKIVIYSPCPLSLKGLPKESLYYAKKMNIPVFRNNLKKIKIPVEVYNISSDDVFQLETTNKIIDNVDGSIKYNTSGKHSLKDFKKFVFNYINNE